MTRDEWIEATNHELNRVYGITLDDCADDNRIDQHYLDTTPGEFVDWIGDKYGLVPIGGWW